MKIVLTVLTCWVAFTCNAQTTDTLSKVASSYFKEAEVASQGQRIWNKKVYGRTMFVNPVTRVTYANMPDSAGILKPIAGIYKGVLPKEVMIANTSITWHGEMWSVILWPLPKDHNERLNLVLHESFHRIQADMGLLQHSPTADHLSTMNGRIYFLLELQALKAALSKPVGHRTADLANALLFRKKRQELFPKTFKNERILEMNEGLAEYTGVILGRQRNNIRQHLYDQIDTAGNRTSLIRSCAYITGPVYGYLLYEKYAKWSLKVDSNSDFPLLISRYYHVNIPRNDKGTAAIAVLEKSYNGNSIISSEKLKEEKHLQAVKAYTEIFTEKPVLTITLIKMNVSFNPNNLFDLGQYGTVYPTAEVKDTWGELTVSAGGMLMKNWKVISLPMNQPYQMNDKVVNGNGWKITLNEGWKFIKVDPLHFTLSNN